MKKIYVLMVLSIVGYSGTIFAAQADDEQIQEVVNKRLFDAVVNGWVDEVARLIFFEHADVNYVDYYYKKSLLDIAFDYNEDEKIIDMLLSYGAKTYQELKDAAAINDEGGMQYTDL